MSNVCDICGKKTMIGNNVSHSQRKTKRKWRPNLQRVKAVIDGDTQHIKACTTCIKSNKVTKAVR